MAELWEHGDLKPKELLLSRLLRLLPRGQPLQRFIYWDAQPPPLHGCAVPRGVWAVSVACIEKGGLEGTSNIKS